jgi:Family of unknown function (DUF6011)
MPEDLNIDTPLLEEAAAAGNPAAFALLAGCLVMTVESKRTGEHITIKLNGKRKSSKWVRAGFEEASHVFVEVPRPNGEWPDKVGTYYPTGRYEGQFWHANNADPARVWAARRVMEVAAGLKDWEDDQCTILQNTHCLYCGRELTDPVSIRRQIGPDCAKTVKLGTHQVKVPVTERLRSMAKPAEEAGDLPGHFVPGAGWVEPGGDREQVELAAAEAARIEQGGEVHEVEADLRAIRDRAAQIKDASYNAAMQARERAEDERVAADKARRDSGMDPQRAGADWSTATAEEDPTPGLRTVAPGASAAEAYAAMLAEQGR